MRQVRGGPPAGLGQRTIRGAGNLSRGDSQDLIVTDIISEGPIQGLVNGLPSVYLNDDSIDSLIGNSSRYTNVTTSEPPSQNIVHQAQSPTLINLTSGSTAASLSNIPEGEIPVSLEEGIETHLVIRGGKGSIQVSLAYVGESGLSNIAKIVLTSASSFFADHMIETIHNTTNNVSYPILSRIPVNLTSSNGEIWEGRLVARSSNGLTADFEMGSFGAGSNAIKPSATGAGETYTLTVDEVVKVIGTGSNSTTGLVAGHVRRAVSDSKASNYANNAKYGRIDWTQTGFRAPTNITSIAMPRQSGAQYNVFKAHTGFIAYFKPLAGSDGKGEYLFRIRSDDKSFMWIGDPAVSPSQSPSNAIIETTSTNVYNYSDPITLTLNQMYPIKITHIEDSGDEYIYFEWKAPGDTAWRTGSNLNVSGKGIFYAPTVNDYRNRTNLIINSLPPNLPWQRTTGSYKFDLFNLETLSTGFDPYEQKSGKYKSVIAQFRPGTRTQDTFSSVIGGGSTTAISNAPTLNAPLEQNVSIDASGGVASAVLIGSSSNGFNLSTAQIATVDKLLLNFSYGSGLFNRNSDGDEVTGYAEYKISIAFKLPGESTFGNAIVLSEREQHSAATMNGISFDFEIPLEGYGNFIDFQITISRLTKHVGDGYSASNRTTPNSDNGDMQATSTIATVTSVIMEKLNHPYTALARVTYNTKDFQSLPKRSYLCKGLKVKVPSNYLNPDEVGGVNSLALWSNNYRRQSNGTNASSYVDWDGSFRKVLDSSLNSTGIDALVYTDNPAWVYYDILINNRYGLGDFLSEQEIDIYQLYRIGRYCDEVVPDGNGSFERRFRSNFYFTKAADAYKVLKDMATNFRSIIYWLDGKIHPVVDQAKDPVYNFSKANVIDGNFTYETTGSKTRSNQVIISWNNPNNNYAIEPLIVEDKNNIIETGKIIRSTALAFGCTSESQARRFGNWKLWTSINQTEACNFQTSINAAFLVPGDIINIQDSARYAKRYSGRVSSTGTRSPGVIPLDSSVTLLQNHNYQLSLLIVKPGAFLVQDTATINGVTYSKGDLIKQAYFGTNTLQDITTEDQSVNAREAAGATGASLLLSWAEYTRVETQAVTFDNSANASPATSLSVDADFSSTPDSETIWVLVESSDINLITKESAKQYKIVSITQESKNQFSIGAIEHYNQKFDSIDEDFNLYIDNTLEAIPFAEDIVVVNKVTNLSSVRVESPTRGKGLKIEWTASSEPTAKYLINHTIGTSDEASSFEVSSTFYTFYGVPTGSYSFSVTVINANGNRSRAETIQVSVAKDLAATQLAPKGVPIGAKTNSKSFIDSTGLFQFQSGNYELIPNTANANRYSNTILQSSYYTQDISTLPTIAEPTRTTDGEFLLDPYYLLFDSDSADKLKLIKYDTTDLTIPFWYDAGTGNVSPTASSSSAWTQVPGSGTGQGGYGRISFSGQGASKKVVGTSGSNFTTNLQVGDVLKLNSSTTPFGIVAVIIDDTNLLVESEITQDAVSYQAYDRLSIRINPVNDVIIGYVYKTSADGFKFKSFLTLESQLTAAPPSITGLVHHIACNSLKDSNKLRDSVGAATPTLLGYSSVQAAASITDDSPIGNSFQNLNNKAAQILTSSESDTLQTGNWSVGLWIKSEINNGSGTATIIARDISEHWGIRLGQNSANQDISWGLGSNSLSSTGDVKDRLIVDQWHHLAIVYKGTTITFFKDGFPIKSGTYNPVSGASDSNDNVVIGGNLSTDYTSNSFVGKYSEIRFYNIALSNEEVMGLYQIPGGAGVGANVDPGVIDNSATQTTGSGNNTVIIDGTSDSNSSDNSTIYRMWTGHADPDSAPFKITDGGKLSLTSGAAHSLDLSASGAALTLGANSTLTVPDDYISGNKIHGGEISGLTGLGISGEHTSGIAVNKPIFKITNTDTTLATNQLGGALEFWHSEGGTLRAGRIASRVSGGTGSATEHALDFYTGTAADVSYALGNGLKTITMKVNAAQAALGIGTLSPTNHLHVFAAHPTIRLESSSAGTGNIDFLGSADSGSVKGSIVYNNNTDSLSILTDGAQGLVIDTNQNITASGNLTGVVNFAYSGTFTGVANTINASYLVNGSTGDINILRNAATATLLQNARLIGGVSFNGGGNINLPGVNQPGNQNTTGSAATLTNNRQFIVGGVNHVFNGDGNVDLTEAVRDLVAGFIVGGTNVTATHNDAANTLTLAASGGGSGIGLTALSVTAEGTPSGDGALSYNNSNGQFTYTPPVDITGNAATATAANTAIALAQNRTIALSGPVTGSINTDLSGTATIPTAIADDAISGDKVHGGTISNATITTAPLIQTTVDGTSANWKEAYDAMPPTAPTAWTPIVKEYVGAGAYGTAATTIGSTVSGMTNQAWYYKIGKLVTITVRLKFPDSVTRNDKYVAITNLPFTSASDLLTDSGYTAEDMLPGSFRAAGYYTSGGYTYSYEGLHGFIIQNSTNMFLAGDLVRVDTSDGSRTHGNSSAVTSPGAHRFNTSPDRVNIQLINNGCQMMFTGQYIAS